MALFVAFVVFLMFVGLIVFFAYDHSRHKDDDSV